MHKLRKPKDGGKEILILLYFVIQKGSYTFWVTTDNLNV